MVPPSPPRGTEPLEDPRHERLTNATLVKNGVTCTGAQSNHGFKSNLGFNFVAPLPSHPHPLPSQVQEELYPLTFRVKVRLQNQLVVGWTTNILSKEGNS